MSLRWKLALAMATLAAVVTSAVGVTAYVLTRDRLLGEVDKSLAESTALVLQRDRRAPGVRPDPGPNRIPMLDLYAAQQIDRDGEIVAGSGISYLPVDGEDREIAERGRGAQTRTVTVDGTRIRIRTVGVRGGGALLVGRDLAEVERVLARLTWSMVVLVVIATGFAAVVGWILAWRMTRSLARLTIAAEHVAATESLDASVPTTGNDEVGRLAGALRNMLASLQSSQRAQQQLVQDASHELRTPLTSIRTNTAVLRKYPELGPDERDRVIADLNDEVEELVALMDELVEAALEGRSDEPTTEIALGDLASRVAARVERRSGHPIVVEADGSVVRGQPGQLERALGNLFGNAVKFDRSTIPVRCVVTHGRVTVTDHGPGIPDVDKGRVFERFYRADAARSAPGSGLGLAIVRDIARAHGGDVFLGDGPEGGAVVGFQLPIVAP